MFRTDNIQELLLYLIDNNNSFVTFQYKSQCVNDKKVIGVNEDYILFRYDYLTKRVITTNIFIDLEKELIPKITEYELLYANSYSEECLTIDSYLLAKEHNNYIIYNYETKSTQIFSLEEILKYGFEYNRVFYTYITRIPIY